MLTRFRPATGEVRAKGVTSAPNAVLHPWVQGELTQVLAARPAVLRPDEQRPPLARWATWLGQEPREPLPPRRLILLWDNLAGQTSGALVRWLFQQGVLPLYRPLSGSWLNMAESLQRIVAGRALAGQHPHSAAELIGGLEDAVASWNAHPTPFIGDGKRRERRVRARRRPLGGSAARLAQRQAIAA